MVSLNACSVRKSEINSHDQTQITVSSMSSLIAIGYIGSTDDDTRHLVKQLLVLKHIEANFSGSVVYYILVEKSQAQAAQDILKGSAELKSKWIKYIALNSHN